MANVGRINLYFNLDDEDSLVLYNHLKSQENIKKYISDAIKHYEENDSRKHDDIKTALREVLNDFDLNCLVEFDKNTKCISKEIPASLFDNIFAI